MYRIITADEFWQHFAIALAACHLAQCPEPDEALRNQFIKMFLEQVKSVGRA